MSDHTKKLPYHEKMDLHPLSDQELREFVLGVVDGRIFVAHQIKDPNMIPMVFMPLALGALQGVLPEELEDKIGTLWEYWDKAGPRSINGYPIFFSMRLLNKEDWARAVKAITVEQERRAQIELPPR